MMSLESSVLLYGDESDESEETKNILFRATTKIASP